AAAPSRTIALTEVGATVTVEISNLPPSPDTATIVLVAPGGLSAPAQVDALSGSATFSGIPYGASWTAHAKVTCTAPGTPAPPPVTETGDSAFDVAGPTVGPIAIAVS
ncbi:MAG: hypothetical protein ABI345_01920, partial [Jatrophihabitans sp.]